jgi:hypothetical protein
MNCEKYRELMVDFLGDEINAADAKQLRQHLRECRGCQEELASLSRTRTLVQQAWPEEPIPQNLVFEFSRRPSKGLWHLWTRYGLTRFALASGTIAACLVLCFLSLALLRAQLRFGEGNFMLSFGRPAEPSSRESTVSPRKPSAVADWLSRREAQDLISRAVAQLDEKQGARVQEVAEQINAQMEAKRTADLRRISNELRALESTQNIVYRQALNNQSYLETLTRDFVLKVNSPGGSTH